MMLSPFFLSSGSTVFAEIQGVIDACIKLSGMPDLSLSFMNPRLLDDVSFHPCIRFKRWESERVLSFIPPDGNFRLISYRVSSQKYVNTSTGICHHISMSWVELPFPCFILTVGYLNSSLLPSAVAHQETQEELVKISV